MSKIKKRSNESGSDFLQKAFEAEQNVLHCQLKCASESITHDGVMGSVNENHFIKILRKYLPKRYGVDSAILIDCLGKTSDQIDIVIYDPQYTPPLLDQNEHKYIPAEAVYAVFEVKPTINKEYLQYAGEKAQSVSSLTRTSIEIPHAGGVHAPKLLINIIRGLIATEIDWVDGFGETFKKNHEQLNGECTIDCALAVSGHYFDTFDGGKYTKAPSKENALIFFLFRLLGKLQSLGTVPAIDWNAYAETLSK